MTMELCLARRGRLGDHSRDIFGFAPLGDPMKLCVVLCAMMLTAGVAFAETPHAPATGTAPHDGHASPGLTLSHDSRWAGGVVIGIAFFFVMAAVIGPIVRANMPEEL